MKRSEMYEKVWSVPMTRLAAELHVSDVGLAKACRRNAIPTPPRGYWAKLAAGKKVPKPPLPNRDNDTEVEVQGAPPEAMALQQAHHEKEQAWLQAHGQIQESRRAESLQLVQSLDDAHPLVRATARLVDQIPAMEKRWERRKPGDFNWDDEGRPPHCDKGRHRLFRKGILNITAGLTNIDLILRFHATVFAALERASFKFAWKEANPSRDHRENKPAAVAFTRKGEQFEFQFSEGYRKVELTKAQIDAYKKQHGRVPYTLYEMVPSGKYTITLTGSEYRANKTWQCTSSNLERRVDDVVAAVDELATLQPLYRKEREEAAARAQLDAERREHSRRIAESRVDQLKRAFAMTDTQDRVDRLRAFLNSLEARGGAYREPYGERLKVWLEVVREELDKSDPVEAMLVESLSAPSWQRWPPAWWPSGLDGGAEESESSPAPDA